MTRIETFIAIVLLFSSALLSATEVALFTLSRFQIRNMKDSLGNVRYRKIKRILQNPSGLLITILILNEFINVCISSILTKKAFHSQTREWFLQDWASAIHPWIVDFIIGTLLTTPVIVLFCEMTPKVIGAYANQLITSLCLPFISLLHHLSQPVGKFLYITQWTLSRIFGFRGQQISIPTQSSNQDIILKEADFLFLLGEGHREGAIQESEYALIQNVFNLDDIHVLDIMTPLRDVKTLAPDINIKDALEIIRTEEYSRIPVLKTNRLETIGILYAKDLLQAKIKPELLFRAVSTIMRKPVFVHGQMKLSTLFRKFKLQQTHMAIVRDSEGLNLGVITMNDVLGNLFRKLKQERSTL